MDLKTKMSGEDISLIKIFKESFYISAFTFGGGYVMLPLMRNRFVEQLKWINEQEMMDLFAIAQTAPGAMAINAAILIGYRLKGIKGTVVAIVATVLPPLVMMTVVSYWYSAFSQNKIIAAALRGMQAGVVAIIMDVVIRMILDFFKMKWIPAFMIMVGAFIAVYIFKVNIALILIVSSILGLISEKIWPKKGGE